MHKYVVIKYCNFFFFIIFIVNISTGKKKMSGSLFANKTFPHKQCFLILQTHFTEMAEGGVNQGMKP